MANSNIHSDEWEDFAKVLRQCKRAPEEFDLRETLDPPPTSGGLYALRGTVAVRNKKTGATRVYPTGHGSSWVADLQRDLEAAAL